MAALALKLTDAGLAAVQGASGADPVLLSHLGLTVTPFDYAPTLTALPGEFKRIEVASGVAASPNVTHLTAYDTSADNWSITGFGLFMDDGVLFAVYTSPDIFMTKAELAFGLMAFDIAFDSDLAANIEYGNAVFAYPPASETMRGVARLARQARVDAALDGEDDADTIVTPKTLRARLSAVLSTVNASLNALSTALDNGLETLRQRRIVGAGLIVGGGDLYADRTLTVSEADPADITSGTSGSKVITPRRLGPITMLLEQNGFIRFFGFQMAWGRFTAQGNASTPVAFAQAFPNACFAVTGGGSSEGLDAKDNWPSIDTSTITRNGFSVQAASDDPVDCSYISVGC
ncbi:MULTISPECIES: hypothetical protein [unclassified Novosphingobium]|uniref:gp53-like domain-containing protein n=1 Tax=unclassified Novosphingobium TaxID=2644732 RepID=UPI00135B2B37|nr:MULTISPECIES: hypothetical protein [unclassified Novosphingobium]